MKRFELNFQKKNKTTITTTWKMVLLANVLIFLVFLGNGSSIQTFRGMYSYLFKYELTFPPVRMHLDLTVNLLNWATQWKRVPLANFLIFLVFLSAYQSTTYLIFFNIEVLCDMLPKDLNSVHSKLFFGRNPKSPKISHFCEF